MSKHSHRCMKCGYLLDSEEPGLCFPCFVAAAKAKLSVGTASGYAPNASAVKKNVVAKDAWTSSLSEIFEPKKTKSSKKLAKKKKSQMKVYIVATPGQPLLGESRRSGRKSNGLHCILCGQAIPFGDMLAHKRTVHAEEPISPSGRGSRGTSRGKRPWVTVYQGGAPGLGKGS